MGLPPSGIVTVRLSKRDADAIDALVEDGHFTSRSDFIRYAVKATAAALLREEPVDTSVQPLAGPGSLGAPGADRPNHGFGRIPAPEGSRRRARPTGGKGVKLQ